MGASGAQALEALKEAPLLHTLTLGLWNNSVGASGAQALAALKEATKTPQNCLFFEGAKKRAVCHGVASFENPPPLFVSKKVVCQSKGDGIRRSPRFWHPASSIFRLLEGFIKAIDGVSCLPMSLIILSNLMSPCTINRNTRVGQYSLRTLRNSRTGFHCIDHGAAFVRGQRYLTLQTKRSAPTLTFLHYDLSCFLPSNSIAAITMSEDEEVHAKLYFLDYKGKVKEIRRMALHSKANWRQWPAVNALVNDMFSVNDSTVTYEDPDQDKVRLDAFNGTHIVC